MPRDGGTAGPKRRPLTHFLCLPLVTSASRPQLETSMKAFKNAVALTGSNKGNKNAEDLPMVHPQAIRPIGALHCTLGVMSLSRQELEAATKLLQELDIDAFLRSDSPNDLDVASRGRISPLKIDFKGLVSMHDPRKTSILYSAPHDSTGRLYSFCLTVQKLFKDAGFLIDDNRELKLHATIVNTIYAKGRTKRPPKQQQRKQETSEPGNAMTDPANAPGATTGGARDSGHGPDANGSVKMDATALLEQYKDFIWAKDVVLDRIAICEMGAKKITDAEFRIVDEEYKEVASVKLPR